MLTRGRRRRRARRRRHRRVVAVRVLDGRDARARGLRRAAPDDRDRLRDVRRRRARRRRRHVRRPRAARARSSARSAPFVAAAVALIAALGEARGARIVPQVRRQVPESWRRVLPVPLAAGLYGVLLGLGFTTFILSFAVWALAGISVALGDPQTRPADRPRLRRRAGAPGDRARARPAAAAARRDGRAPADPALAARARRARARRHRRRARRHARPGRRQRRRRRASRTRASTARCSRCTAPAAPASCASPAGIAAAARATTRRSAAAASRGSRARASWSRTWRDPRARRRRARGLGDWVAWRAGQALYAASLDPAPGLRPAPGRHRRRRQAGAGRQPARVRPRRPDRGARPRHRRSGRCCAARRARELRGPSVLGDRLTYVRATYKRQQVLTGVAGPAQRLERPRALRHDADGAPRRRPRAGPLPRQGPHQQAALGRARRRACTTTR